MSKSPSLSSKRLVDFLDEVDSTLNRAIQLVAVGGTAMTFLSLKPSTIDIDFTGPSEDILAFERAHRSLPHGFIIHCWKGGQVFMVALPDDYMEKSKSIPTKLSKIRLLALSPLDIVVTKLARLNRRDWEDIAACIQAAKLTASDIRLRCALIGYAGSDTNYEINRDAVISKFFD